MSLKKKPHDDDADIGLSKKVTGKELTLSDEISTRLDTLVQLLQDKGIINKKEYESTVAMRLHETSKATAFEEMDEEI
jgi:predicted transcriptional regulator YheO